jgi:hypothetical protein
MMHPRLRLAACFGGAIAGLVFGGCIDPLSLAVVPKQVQRAEFPAASDPAITGLIRLYYRSGYWSECSAGCSTTDSDWGADALTATLFFAWRLHDATVVPYLRALAAHAPRYQPCGSKGCRLWSDTPAWDAVAAAEAYQATHDPADLAKAVADYEAVERSPVFGGGACRQILYQRPGGGGTHIKTLETAANLVKAGLLLYAATGSRRHLGQARAAYQAIRRSFLDRRVALYTNYLIDDGRYCRQLGRRFFASTNGLMIQDGLLLARATGERRYARQALQTARAVDRYLSDPAGVYENLEAENDVAEPLVEAMTDEALRGAGFARRWVIRNALAAASACSVSYVCGRFFGGPPPLPGARVTAWQTNGALAVFVAARFLGIDIKPGGGGWRAHRFVLRSVRGVPLRLRFTGSGIALVGTLGERCCQYGHARVLVDNTPTFDETGIWQNKTACRCRLPYSVLFAWTWPRVGHHDVDVVAADDNPEEGGTFFHLRAYEIRCDRRPLWAWTPGLGDGVQFPAPFLRQLHGQDACGHEHEARQKAADEIGEDRRRIGARAGRAARGELYQGVVANHEFAAAPQDCLRAPVLVQTVRIVGRSCGIEVGRRVVVRVARGQAEARSDLVRAPGVVVESQHDG